MTAAEAVAGRRRGLGTTIGGAFGLAFVLANAETPLGAVAADSFRALAATMFIALMLAQRRARERSGAEADIELFGPRYWLVVAGEVATLLAGLVVIRALDAPAAMYLPWTVLVVGAHFLAFVYVGIWPRRIVFMSLVLIALGIAGLTIAGTAGRDWTPFVSGVLTGFTMLASLLATLRRRT